MAHKNNIVNNLGFRSILFFLLASLTVSIQTQAFPHSPGDRFKDVWPKKWATKDNYNFNGIVSIAYCSGSLIIFEGQPRSSNALVLTNGHCHKNDIAPQEVLVNQPLKLTMRVGNANRRTYSVHATTIVYATMTKTDVLLYRLKETYNELAAKNITPLVLSPFRPQPGSEIEIISGLWKKGYSCSIDGFVHKLLEGNWEFQNSLRYTRPGCHTTAGTSGSPIILKGTRRVIGINNILNAPGLPLASEVAEDGTVTVDRNRGYGQQTYILYSCLDSDYKIDLTLQGCWLNKPNKIRYL